MLGAPRSGTTWLAKIIDSHPDVLYRHEPDAVFPGPSPVTAEVLPALLATWAADRSPRSAKQPLFPKSWQPRWAHGLRTLIATFVSAAERLPRPLNALAGLCRIPDLGVRPAPRIAIKSVAWAAGAAVLARSLPASRTIFILRHPCGQVDSVMRGHRLGLFDLKTAGTDMPFGEAEASGFAASHGVGEAAFRALPVAAKYAWSWRAFNEPAHAALAAQPNVKAVIYETLCVDPVTICQAVFGFIDLYWDEHTKDFICRSSGHRGKPGYYTLFRNAAAAAENWRVTMPATDQNAVRSVVAASPLAGLWPDILV